MDGAGKSEMLTPKKLFDLWRRLNPQFPCRYCGAVDSWDVGDPLSHWDSPSYSEISGVLQYVRNKNGEPVATLESTPFTCTNCGLTEIFSNGPLVALARSRGLESD